MAAFAWGAGEIKARADFASFLSDDRASIATHLLQYLLR
jgi:hypothetical protein